MSHKNMKISTDTLNRVLEYLTTKPWKESNGLISDIHKDITPIKDEVPKPSESFNQLIANRFN